MKNTCYSKKSYTFASDLKTKPFTTMATITITQRKKKSFKDISIQCERIFTMHLYGYGTQHMIEVCEDIFFRVLKKNGY